MVKTVLQERQTHLLTDTCMIDACFGLWVGAWSLARGVSWNVIAYRSHGVFEGWAGAMAGLWLARSRGKAAATSSSTPGASSASTPEAPSGEVSRRRRGAAASRTPPPRRGRAASRTPPAPWRPRRGRAASRTPPAPRSGRAAAAAQLGASTPERARPGRTVARRRDPDLHALVGPASESAKAHEARHPRYGRHQTCPRCRFYKIGPSWVSAYGTMPAPGHGPDQVQWIAERPSHWGGPWALGCTICGHAMAQKAGASSGASTPAMDAAQR